MADEAARPGPPAEAEIRRWRLVARLGEVLDQPGIDWPGFAASAARIIADEMDVVALVVLTALPGHDTAIAAAAHRDPLRHAKAQALLARFTDEDLRRLSDSFATAPGAVITDPAESASAPYRAGEAEYAAFAGGVQSRAGVAVRHRGQILGAIACNRDATGPPFDAPDLSALAAAADLISVRVDNLSTVQQERADRDQWSEVFATAPISMVMTDRQGRITAANPAATEILGVALTELLGQEAAVFTAPEDRPLRAERIAALLEGRARTAMVRRRMIRPDGGERWVQTTRCAIRDASGAVQGVLSQSIDITDRKRAEDRAEGLTDVLHSSPDFIAMAGLDGAMQFVNAAGRALVHLPHDLDATTTSIADYAGLDPDAGTAQERLRAMMQTGFVESGATLRDWKDDTSIPVWASTFLVHDAHTGDAVAIATIRRDMRDELAARNRLQTALTDRAHLLADLLAAEENERSRIAEDVHDDALQLLAAAQLRGQLLGLHLRRSDLAQAEKTLSDIADLIDETQRGLRRLLTALEPADTDGASLAADIRRAAARLFAETDIVVTVEGELADLPGEIATLLGRGIREALSNARRHGRPRSVVVALAVTASHWRARIDDDGIGIPEEIPDRPGHLGIRAMTARIEAVGGRCSVARQPHGGTRVEMTVPRTALTWDPSPP